ncbi:hypothetical protein ACFL5Q_06375 [Planctomycetota bacterium]
MRSLQFTGLQRILHLVEEFQDGIRAGELNEEIFRRAIYVTARGLPAKSTLYHCRTALLHLGAIMRCRGRLAVNRDDPLVAKILDSSSPEDKELSPGTREAFAALVLGNADCRNGFFRLFVGDQGEIATSEFRKGARSVVWNPTPAVNGKRTAPKNNKRRKYQAVDLRSEILGEKVTLASPVQIQAILWGVRFWALELGLIGEFFETGRGSVMYPIRLQEPTGTTESVIAEFLSIRADPGDWTTLSVHEMLNVCCKKKGYAVEALFDGIRAFVKTNPGYVTLIPTIPNFAAIAATSTMREKFELTSYFTDFRGRFISHIRFHNTIREPEHGKSSKKGRKKEGRSRKG